MKLVMFSPGLRASAIGKVACLVTQALGESGHEVAVVRTEAEQLLDAPAHAFGVHVLRWTDQAAVGKLLTQADGVVYHVGDNFLFHAGCLHWLAQAPGIVCLHDFFLGHLFTEWSLDKRMQAVAIVQAWYGEQTASGYFEHVGSRDFIEATREAAPLTEWIAAQARAVLTHSSWGVERVLASCPGPVRVVPLAYAAADAAGALPVTSDADQDAFRILTVGHVNPNKRADSVIRAIAASEELRRQAVYTLAGAVAPEMAKQLRELAASLRVRVDILGEVDAAALGSLLRRADVVCCLRRPTLEAASASTIEAMLSGKVVIVEDAGFYSELPDECVRKIRPECEVDDLASVLDALRRDEAGRIELATRAGYWSRTVFTANNYSTQLVELVHECRRIEPLLVAMGRMAGHLRRWGRHEDLLASDATLGPLQALAPAAAER